MQNQIYSIIALISTPITKIMFWYLELTQMRGLKGRYQEANSGWWKPGQNSIRENCWKTGSGSKPGNHL